MTRDEIYKKFRICDTRINARLTTAKHIMFISKDGASTLIITKSEDGTDTLKVYTGKKFTRDSQNTGCTEETVTSTVASLYFTYEYIVFTNKYYTWDEFLEKHGV